MSLKKLNEVTKMHLKRKYAKDGTEIGNPGDKKSFIQKKMKKMKKEKIPHKQKVAIAHSYARKAGHKV